MSFYVALIPQLFVMADISHIIQAVLNALSDIIRRSQSLQEIPACPALCSMALILLLPTQPQICLQTACVSYKFVIESFFCCFKSLRHTITFALTLCLLSFWL